MIDIPAAVIAMSARGPQWAAWVGALPATVDRARQQWGIRIDGTPTHGHCSLVLPVRTGDGTPAMLKIGFPDEESAHEHLALRRWGGHGAVRLLSADPHHRVLLLERLAATDLTGVSDEDACQVVAGLYRELHVPALPALRPLSFFVDRWTAELAALPRSAPIPHRLVERAVALGRELTAEDSGDRVIHTDLHYANVLAANVLAANVLAANVLAASGPPERTWLAIDPKPVNGDPHYEIAPMLWNRWDELEGGGDVRERVRRRFWTLVDAAGFDEDRARAWVLVRMMHNAMWAAEDGDHSFLTVCIAIAKAVQD